MATLILFPAIDLKDGVCVRLKRGEMADATVFNRDPAAQARTFERAGFQWLHCVDLNGAFQGRSVNGEAVKQILSTTSLPVQLGGGIRDMRAVESWLAAGVARVILGTAALTNPALVREAARSFPGRVVVGADARNGKVATSGWAEVSDLTPIDLGKRFEDAGVAAILFTDVESDGVLGGINLGATAALARALTIPVIASGGVSGLADIDALIALAEPNLVGLVIGRALYDGRLSPTEALARANTVNKTERI
jgi:phosphoribosylformimino-5-aminoimidazole carboxamide ribotide isomerase